MTFALLKKAVVHYGSDATANGLKIQIALCRILCKMVLLKWGFSLHVFLLLGLLVKGNRLACRRFANVECIEDIIELINNPKILHRKKNVFFFECLFSTSPSPSPSQLSTHAYCTL